MPPSKPPSKPSEFKEASVWFRNRVPLTKLVWEALEGRAQRNAFTVAGVAQLDLISDVQKSLDKAIAKGMTLEAWKKSIGAKLEKEWAGTVANPPARLECLTGDALVSGAMVRTAHRRWSECPVVEVRTARGRQFTATPNHPMLTPTGWKLAGQLREGDELVGHTGEENAGSRGNQDHANGPSRIEEIFETLSGRGPRQRIESHPLDFHGDGSKGDIDIVGATRPLMVGSFSPLRQHQEKLTLSSANLSPSLFCGECGHLSVVSGRCGFCDRPTVLARLLEPKLDDSVAYAEVSSNVDGPFTGAIPAQDDARRDVTPDRWPPSSGEVILAGLAHGATHSREANDVRHPSGGVADDVGHLRDAQARDIQIDRVVAVRSRLHRGHVFNLSTPFGYYLLDGLVTGNTIFRTNVQMAYAYGRRQQMTDPAVLRFRPFWKYLATLDSRTTEICSHLNGTLLPANHVFWQSHSPPCHFQCRSTIQALSRARAEDKGLTEEVPKTPAQEGFGGADPVAWQPDLGKIPNNLSQAFRDKQQKTASRPKKEKKPKVRGTMAKEVEEKWPKLAKLFGSKLIVDESSKAEAILNDMEKLPSHVLKKLAGHLDLVHIGRGSVVDLDPEMGKLGPVPQGDGTFAEWKHVAGVFQGGKRQVQMGSIPHGSDSIAIHELAHAWDHELTGSSFARSGTTSFRNVWEKWRNEGDNRTRFSYLTQDRIGPAEAFAEISAVLLKRGRKMASLVYGKDIVAEVAKTYRPPKESK